MSAATAIVNRPAAGDWFEFPDGGKARIARVSDLDGGRLRVDYYTSRLDAFSQSNTRTIVLVGECDADGERL